MPKVSIVLPTYNGEKYLKQSIESILMQTYKDWELIIVNDCSTDGTQQIIDSYAKKDARIRTITNAVNEKLPESLNIGFREAKGDYYTWTSDDNEYLPKAIETMLKYMEQNKTTPLVCTRCNIIDENGEVQEQTSGYSKRDMLINNCVGACFLYRREAAEKVGQYNRKKFLVEDYDYWLRILFAYNQIGAINGIYYRYRQHGGSLTGKRKAEIQRQLLLLHREYFPRLLEELKMDKAYLCCLYYEFKWNGMLDAKIKDILEKLIPEINMDEKEISDQKIVIYGAGTYGRKAYERYGEKIGYYADKNPALQGTMLNGKKVISLTEMQNKSAGYQIFIAVSSPYIYEFFKTLETLGIEKCHVIDFPIEN